MVAYTFDEYTDMLLTLGECLGNANAAVRRYGEKFPLRNVPNLRTFLNVERRLRETGKLEVTNNTGRPRIARTVEDEEQILHIIEQDPTLSTRQLALMTGNSQSTVSRVLREQCLHAFHFRKVQELVPDDLPNRIEFCQVMLENNQRDPHFFDKIFFTDEATFTRQGVFNTHNSHFYAEENPFVVREHNYQHTFKVNVWAATMGNRFIGFFILPGNLNGDMYLNFLENQLFQILDDVPIEMRNNMIFMHDGAPPHFTRAVRMWLHQKFPNRWIGRGADAPIHWPARSPDLNPLDFTVWSYLKSKVYSSEINSVVQLRRRVENECTALMENDHILNRIMVSLRRRLNLCIEENGGHFEHLL